MPFDLTKLDELELALRFTVLERMKTGMDDPSTWSLHRQGFYANSPEAFVKLFTKTGKTRGLAIVFLGVTNEEASRPEDVIVPVLRFRYKVPVSEDFYDKRGSDGISSYDVYVGNLLKINHKLLSWGHFVIDGNTNYNVWLEPKGLQFVEDIELVKDIERQDKQAHYAEPLLTVDVDWPVSLDE